MNKERALYVAVPQIGSGWNVQHANSTAATGSVCRSSGEGYGSIPVEYAGLPVLRFDLVDFDTVLDRVIRRPFNRAVPREACYIGEDPSLFLPLVSWLAYMRDDQGVPVENFPAEVEE